MDVFPFTGHADSDTADSEDETRGRVAVCEAFADAELDASVGRANQRFQMLVVGGCAVSRRAATGQAEGMPPVVLPPSVDMSGVEWAVVRWWRTIPIALGLGL